MIVKKEYDMDNILPISLQIGLKCKDSDLLDIETGEMIRLNGYNGTPDLARLSLPGNFNSGEQFSDELNNNSVLEIEL